MSLIIALIILSSTIAIMFSQEFSNGFKRILSIPGMALFLPLFVLSYCLLANQLFVFWLVEETQKFLNEFLMFIQSLLPFQKGRVLFTSVGFISIIALIPQAIMAYKKVRRIHTTFTHAWLVSIVSWLTFATLLISIQK